MQERGGLGPWPAPGGDRRADLWEDSGEAQTSTAREAGCQGARAEKGSGPSGRNLSLKAFLGEEVGGSLAGFGERSRV